MRNWDIMSGGIRERVPLTKKWHGSGWKPTPTVPIARFPGWSYRTPITIEEQSGSNLENYQVLVELNNTNFNFEDAQSNGEDIRFTLDNYTTLIDYWIEEWNKSGESAKIWVKVPSIPSLGATVIYMHYGNLSANSESNGDNTFEFFADFESYEEEIFSVDKTLVSLNGIGNDARHNTINFIDKALCTFNGNQYIAFINSGGYVVVGKRNLPNGSWSLHDTGRTVHIADLHNVVSMGIDFDGYIHIAWDMHGHPLKYARSDNPEDPSAFTNQAMVGSNEDRVTYPRFFKANDILYFSYRNSSSQYLNKYNVSTSSWSALQHPLINCGSPGVVYADNFAVDKDGYIHISFMWRTSTSPIILSDYSYAYSDDGGTTWKKSDGALYSLPIDQTNAEKFEPGSDSGVINQNHIDVDGDGHPHIAYWKNAPNGHVNYYHVWHNGTQWQKTQLTNYIHTPTGIYTGVAEKIARPGIIVNRSNGKVYVFTRESEDGWIRVFYALPPYTSWDNKRLGDHQWGYQEFGGVDYFEWHNSNIFYFMASRADAGVNTPVFILKSNLVDVENSFIGSSKWIIEKNGFATIENKRLKLISSGSDNNPTIRSKGSFGPLNIALDFKMQHTTYPSFDGACYGGMASSLVWGDGDWLLPFRLYRQYPYIIDTSKNGNTTQTITTIGQTAREKLRTVVSYFGHAKYYFDNANGTDHITNIPDSPMYVCFGQRTNFSGSAHPSFYKDIRVRKYVSPEPLISKFGAAPRPVFVPPPIILLTEAGYGLTQEDGGYLLLDLYL